MSLPESIRLVSVLQAGLAAVAAAALIRHPSRREFSALKVYLLASALFSVPLNVLLFFRVLPAVERYSAYATLYWCNYVVGALSIFFVVQQLFAQALAPLPGLRRLGLIIFRWIAISSGVVVIASAVLPSGLHLHSLNSLMYEMMRCICVMELCLLAFLALSVHPLGFSFKSTVFGLGLGLGIAACADLVCAALMQAGSPMASGANLLGQVGDLLGVSIWIVYLLKPEPLRRAVTLPVTSPLLRWNEIANALGHTGGQVVVSPAPAFFLQDVEKVVDRVLSKNALNENRAS